MTGTYTGAGDGVAQALSSHLRGALIQRGDASYDAARTVWNGAYDRSPACIAQVTCAEDVGHCIRVAAEYDLEVAVRSGGHSMTAKSMVDGGLVIDLSTMRAMDLNPVTGTARIEAGRTWGEVAVEAQKYGLALSSGDMASVGVGGLTLGGGIGWLVRKHGLTIDHLMSAELVTADGHVRRASERENPDLFWAIRGGGGNFGVVTSFEFRLQPVGMVLSGVIIYDAAEAGDVLRAYGEYAQGAPDELTTITTVMHAPPLPFLAPEHHGKPVVIIMPCYAGDLERGEQVLAPLARLGAPVCHMIAPMPYPALFSFTEEGEAKGLQHAVRTMFMDTFDDRAVDAVLQHIDALPAPLGMVQFRVLGGAMGRVPETATAFAHRDARTMLTVIDGGIAPGLAPDEGWVNRVWDAVRAYASGAYVNFLGDEGDDRIYAAYKPATIQRLAAIKRHYDPANMFHLNQNIAPLSGRESVERAA